MQGEPSHMVAIDDEVDTLPVVSAACASTPHAFQAEQECFALEGLALHPAMQLELNKVHNLPSRSIVGCLYDIVMYHCRPGV